MALILQDIFSNFDWPVALLAAIVGLALYAYTGWRNLPPGPVGIPYIGYYPFLKTDFTAHLRDLAKRYGDVFCFRCTGQIYVHLNSLRAIKEAHVTKSECFSVRPTNYSVVGEFFSDGVGFLNGEAWKVMRKFFVQTLKEFGMGKEGLENVITERLKHILEVLRKSDGKNVEAPELLAKCSNFAMIHLLFHGSKIKEEDTRQLDEAYEDIMKFAFGKRMLLAGSLTRYFLFLLVPDYRKAKKNLAVMDSIFAKIIKEHEETFEKDNLRDLVDYYLNERRILQERGDAKAKMYTDRCLIRTLLQFYGDGSFSIGWFVSRVMRILADHPEVQRQIQSEIDQVVGRERMPSWTDKARLPYTIAAIYEAQRTFVFPLFPSLECTRETTIQGHRIPKGAITLPNTLSAHHDPEVYKNEETFDPMRFMSTGGKDVRADLPILFGIGKRSCPGESLTNMQVLLSVVAVLQAFDLHPPEIDPSRKAKGDMEDEWETLITFTPRAS